MLSIVRRTLVLSLVLLAGSTAQALTIQSASIGDGQGCTDLACTTQTHTYVAATTAGGGTISLAGSTLTFSISGLGATFAPGVTFSGVSFDGTATVVGAGVFAVTGGSATVGGTFDDGTASALATAAITVGGTCTDLGGNLACGLLFSFATPDGITFKHTVNLATPEPATAGLLGLALLGVAAVRRRS